MTEPPDPSNLPSQLSPPSQPSLPSGTVAFLFTDIEDSMVGWERHPRAMAGAVARHDALLRAVIADHHGHVFKTIGDAFCAVFPSVGPAVAAAVAAQRALVAEPWGDVGAVHVRMAIHLGDADERDADYFGPAVNRVARLLAAGHGGQILLSAVAADVVRDHLPPTEHLRDLGAHLLKGLSLPERILQLVADDLRAEFPPLATLDNRPNNLPPQLTSLVGREHEVAAVRELLERDDVRLVTLTGPGGVGKTRLSLQVAAEMLDTYTDGVFFVLLEQTTDAALELPTIAQTLGLRESPGKALAETLRDYLRSKHLLLDLDNVEQIVGAGPPLVETLRGAPAVKILVSSRVRLGVQGEREYAVSSLSLPPRRGKLDAADLLQYAAVRLFVERAQAVRADFTLTDANAAAVTDICRALDGLPLAIELAAAWIRVMPPRAMLPQLEHRLNLLTGGGQDRPERQQTLRGAIAWSYDLLKPDQRTLLARLSVFAGGFTLDAAAAVVNADGALDLFPHLTALVDQNLVWHLAGDADGEARFGMLATIREFAHEQLKSVGGGEDVLIQMLHAEYFLDLAERVEPELTGAEQAEWLERLEGDNDNLRSALDWLHESGEAELGLRLAGALRRFWYIRGYSSEGRDWLERGLEQWEDASPPVVAKALDAAGVLALSQGDYRQASGLFEQALELYGEAGNASGQARALVQLGLVALEGGHYDRAEEHYQDGLALYRELGDNRGVSVQLANLGALAFHRGDLDRAVNFYGESLTISRKTGDQQEAAIALANLAEAREYQANYERATALYEEALPLFRRLGDKGSAAFTLSGLGRMARLRGETPRAARLFAESLALCHETGDYVGIAAALESVGVMAAEWNDAAGAARILGAAAALRHAIDAPLADAYRTEHERKVARLRAQLGEEVWSEEWAAGQALSVDDAVVEAEWITADIGGLVALDGRESGIDGGDG